MYLSFNVDADIELDDIAQKTSEEGYSEELLSELVQHMDGETVIEKGWGNLSSDDEPEVLWNLFEAMTESNKDNFTARLQMVEPIGVKDDLLAAKLALDELQSAGRKVVDNIIFALNKLEK